MVLPSLQPSCPPSQQATLEKCSTCSQPILDRILRAMGKAYHPGCFTCVVCHRGLDGIPFTVDATSQIHCIEDFHRSAGPPTFFSGCLLSLSFSSLLVSGPAPPVSHPCHALFWLTSLSFLACPLLSCISPSLGSTVSLLQPWGLTTPWFSCIYPRKFAPRCSVCGGAIMPEPGQEETVRIVALDRSFHIGCYKCEVRGPGPGEKEFLGSGLAGYSRTQKSWPGGKLLLLF